MCANFQIKLCINQNITNWLKKKTRGSEQCSQIDQLPSAGLFSLGSVKHFLVNDNLCEFLPFYHLSSITEIDKIEFGNIYASAVLGYSFDVLVVYLSISIICYFYLITTQR